MALLGRSEVVPADDNQGTTNKPIPKVYFIIAVIAVLFLVAARICVLRSRNRPFTDFFSPRRSSPLTELFSARPSNPYDNSQAPEDHTFSSSYQPSHRIHRLTPPPLVHHHDRRVNAADTDSAGRRIGGPDDPDWDGKDILPAYNEYDRPPKYDFGGVPPTQGYTASAENYPRNHTVAASTEATPVVEDQSVASLRTGPSDGDDPTLPAPRHEAST